MTDERTTHDSIESKRSERTARTESPPEDDGPSVPGKRSVLKRAAAGIAGLAGIGAASGSASAFSHRIVVVGKGRGKHSYEIKMEGPNDIYKATHAGPNDRKTTDDRGDEMTVHGEVWNWNVDSYRYTGPIDHVEADGQVAFHFPDGTFPWADVYVDGRSSGRHDYSIATNDGDIDKLSRFTGSGDTDRGPSSSERENTPDSIEGYVNGRNRDAYDVTGTVDRIHVDSGHLRFKTPACAGCGPPEK